MPENFDYGFDLGAFVEREFERYESDTRQVDEGTDLLLREFDDYDDEYVEFNDEVFDL